MAIVQAINQVISTTITNLFTATSQDYMIIGGAINSLLPTDAYVSIPPYFINAKVEQGIPFQVQTKFLIPETESLQAWATETPVNILWSSGDILDWNSDDINDWNTANPGTASVSINLTLAGIG